MKKPRVFEKVIAEDGTAYLVTDWKGRRYTATIDPKSRDWFVVTERLCNGQHSKGKFFRRIKDCPAFDHYSMELNK